MATAKDLLKTAILKVGSNGAMPSNQIITLVRKTNYNSPNNHETVAYVAPCDGVLSAFFQGSGLESGTLPGVDIRDADGRRHAARTTDGSVYMTLRKGCTVNAGFYEANPFVNQWYVLFVKTIGGGYSRYLPSLSRNRFGGALWLRLKTTSETLPRLVAGSRSRLSVASSSRASHLHLAREIASTCRQQTVFASFGLRVPVSTLRFANPVAHNLSRQTVLQAGRKPACLVPVDKGSTMRLGVRSREESSISFLLSVASNNARMEVAA